jgi:hypothetical protein
MVILLPIFAGLLLVFAFLAQLMLSRLALIQLTRDSALYLARDSTLWLGDEDEQLAAVRQLAQGRRLLDPQALGLKLEPLAMPFQDQGGALVQSAMDSGAMKLVRSVLLGKRLTLSLHLRFGGLAGRIFPSGLTLNESVALQGDAWDFGNGLDVKKRVEALFKSLL